VLADSLRGGCRPTGCGISARPPQGLKVSVRSQSDKRRAKSKVLSAGTSYIVLLTFLSISLLLALPYLCYSGVLLFAIGINSF
jgi:hypothetical protein